VPGDQRDQAIATLERAGFTGPPEPDRTHWFRSSFELPLTSPGPVGVAFELHWNVAQAMRYRTDTAGLLARALHSTSAVARFLRLDEHDAVAHLLLHHVQHYFDRRLKWVIEVGLLARSPGFSWPRVAERLTAWGGRGAADSPSCTCASCFPRWLAVAAYDALPAAAWRLLATLPLRATASAGFSIAAPGIVSCSSPSRPPRSRGRGTCPGT